jgi:hypothetical protein
MAEAADRTGECVFLVLDLPTSRLCSPALDTEWTAENVNLGRHHSVKLDYALRPSCMAALRHCRFSRFDCREGP